MTCPNPACGALIRDTYPDDDCPDCGCFLYPTRPADVAESAASRPIEKEAA